jgi:alanine racemase
MGRVSMDSIIVDVTGVSLEPGMLIDLIGPHHDADQAGSAAGTIGYEILTSLGHRFQRRIIPLD